MAYWRGDVLDLDPIIQELRRFCENHPEGKDQLSDLRLALKIGDRHAPDDSASIERRWQIEQRWIAAYLHMQDSKEYPSENKIATQIGDSMKVSSRTALNHWKERFAIPW